MTEKLPIKYDESKNTTEILADLKVLRDRAIGQRAIYQDTLREMTDVCSELRGTELIISGKLHGRGGTTVYSYEPESDVDNLHVRVGSANVNASEGGGTMSGRQTPSINIVAWTVEDNEMVCATLDDGERGVSYEVVTKK